MLAEVRGTQSRSYWDGTFPRFPASGYSSFDLRSVSGAKGGSSKNILAAQIAETLKAVAKRRAALRARLRVACRRLRSEQFRTASMSCRPRCGRLSVRQHGSVSCWWSLLGGRPHVGHEAAVHHAARQRGGGMAARGARAGVRLDPLVWSIGRLPCSLRCCAAALAADTRCARAPGNRTVL